MACLLDIQQNSLLNDVEISRLLLNLKELYILHLKSWIDIFLPILSDQSSSKGLGLKVKDCQENKKNINF